MTAPIDRDLMQPAAQEYQRPHEADGADRRIDLSQTAQRGPRLGRRTLLQLIAATGTLTMTQALLACAPAATTGTSADSGTAASNAAAPASGGELTAGWAGLQEITTLDPAQIGSAPQFQIASNVLSGLVHITPELIAEGDLAESWEITADGLEWTFMLRQGVTWHDGAPLTADDVLFTFNRSKDPEQSIHSSALANVDSCEKIDDHTVKFIMGKPQASFITKTLERASGRALTIVSKKAIEELGLEQYALTPVGTGPFRVTSHALGQSLVLEKFANYYDPERPKLDKVTILPISEPEPLAAAIEAGDIQLIGGFGPSAELIDRFVANPELVVSEVTGPGFSYLALNPHVEPFKVPDFNKPFAELLEEPGFKVRLAIAKAIDRDDYVTRAFFGRAIPSLGGINPAMRFFFDTAINDVSEQRFDLARAQELLAEAGFPNGEGLPTLKLITTPAARRASEIMVDILKKNIGLTVELDVVDSTVLGERTQAMDYQLVQAGSGGDYDPDDALVDFLMSDSKFNGSARPAELPFGYFSDAEVDALIQQQRAESDPAKRKELVQQANLITSNKVALAFTHYPLDTLVYRTEVNFPEVSRIPGLVDLDRVTLNS